MRSISRLIFVIVCSTSIYAQHLNIPFLQGQPAFPNAAIMGFAGASVANPHAQSLQINPAGIVQQNRSLLHGSFLSLRYKDIASYNNQDMIARDSFSKLSEIGLNVAVPTVRGALVFGVSYQRRRQLDGLFEVSWLGTTDVEFFNPNEFVALDVDKFADEYVEGYISQTSIGGGAEMAPGLFAGLSVNFHSGHKDRTFFYDELGGTYNITFSTGNVMEGFLLPDYYSTRLQKEIYSGVNFTGGFQYQVHPKAWIGATLETPYTLKTDRDWSLEEKEVDFLADSITYSYKETGNVIFKVKHPWVFRFGGSVDIGPVSIAADLAWKDYSQAEYETDYPENDHNQLSVNYDIRDLYQETLDIHLGGLIQIPKTPVILRGGFARLPSYHKDYDPMDIYTIGLGAVLNPQFQLDAGYSRAYWDGPGFQMISNEKIESDKIQISIQYLVQ